MKVLWRRKLVCLVVALVVFLGGAAYLIARPKVYESTASVALLPASNNTSALPNYPNIITSLIPTYIQLVSSPALLNQVAPVLPFKISEAQLANDVFGESLSNAAVINIVGVSSDPVRAQQIAAATTAAFLARVKGNGLVTAQIYGRPQVPTRPASPRTKLLLVAMAVIAVLLGLAAGLIWDRMSGHEEDTEQPVVTTGPPVLGVIREPTEYWPSSIREGLDGSTAPDGWRSLRTNFMYASLGQRVHSVTVMSPGPGGGNSTAAANLAAAVAEMGMAVVLVDADVHHARLHEVLGMANGRGLTSTILEGANPATLLRPVPGIANLQVITAGPPLPTAQRDEERLYRKQLPRLTSLAELVIVAGPSLAADASLVAGVTDGVVLVVDSGALTWKQVGAIVDDLTSTGARVIGTVLTRNGHPPGPGKPGRRSGPGKSRARTHPAKPVGRPGPGQSAEKADLGGPGERS
jgi:Mrp family chromosome partitioning ATPase